MLHYCDWQLTCQSNTVFHSTGNIDNSRPCNGWWGSMLRRVRNCRFIIIVGLYLFGCMKGDSCACPPPPLIAMRRIGVFIIRNQKTVCSDIKAVQASRFHFLIRGFTRMRCTNLLTKARFPLLELTARVNSPSWRVTGFHYSSTRAVNTARQLG